MRLLKVVFNPGLNSADKNEEVCSTPAGGGMQPFLHRGGKLTVVGWSQRKNNNVAV